MAVSRRSVPGAFDMNFIGSTCTALPWGGRAARGTRRWPSPASPPSPPRAAAPRRRPPPQPPPRGLHSSTYQLHTSNFSGTLWVPSVYRWVITRHKLDTKRLTDQNGSGSAEEWTSVSPCLLPPRVTRRRLGPAPPLAPLLRRFHEAREDIRLAVPGFAPHYFVPGLRDGHRLRPLAVRAKLEIETKV